MGANKREFGMASTCRSYCFQGFTKAAVVDVETTGLDKDKDRIVSLAVLRVDFPELVKSGNGNADYFAVTLDPGVPISEEARKIHGIDDAQVAGQERFEDIAEDLRDFIGDLPIVGHNIQFDKKMLTEEFKRARVRALGKTKSFCTQKRMKEHFGYTGQGWRLISLDKAAKYFGLDGRKDDHHSAMKDAQLTLQVAAGLYKVDNGLEVSQESKGKGVFGPPPRIVSQAWKRKWATFFFFVIGGLILLFLI